jgi:hypothetical protein
VAVFKPQSTELGGFILIQGTKQQIDSLRGDHDFGRWITQGQLVADKVGIVDAWVNHGLLDAIDPKLRQLVGRPPVHRDAVVSWRSRSVLRRVSTSHDTLALKRAAVPLIPPVKRSAHRVMMLIMTAAMTKNADMMSSPLFVEPVASLSTPIT